MNRVELLASLAPEGFITQGREDVHVHTEHCDDASYPVFAVLRDAVRRNLRWVNVTRHVREDTPLDDVERFVDEVVRTAQTYKTQSDIVVTTSVETKMVNTAGDVDLPPGANELVDFLLVADHQMPMKAGAVSPSSVKGFCDKGEMSTDFVVEELFAAYSSVMERYPGNILAHPFSVLPKMGIEIFMVNPLLWKAWAKKAVEAGCAVDVNSKWLSPPREAFPHLIGAGVPLLSGSDVHRPPTSFQEFINLTAYQPLTVVTGEGYETPVFREM